ncbi:hypothetical protein EDB92DRAFT_1943166 [Lactarius akahatsu]|uniref:Uncharacterized protein n=1 Tax=Lactarius akahatsu TaxID=416441 RepID=A0AAD4QFT3_9AGAM|nr:hypothetical protein EDB92DRAFT_1943166 [Lactarius akahatsu]
MGKENAFWKDDEENPGYFTYYVNRQGQSQLIPVEFNFDNLCWVEIQWNDIHNKYQVNRPASSSLSLDILQSNVTTRDQWGPIDGEEEEPARSPTPKTPAPSPSITSNPEEICIIKDQQEEERLEQIAKSIPTDMSGTTTLTMAQARTAIFGKSPDEGGGGGGGAPPGGDPDNNPHDDGQTGVPAFTMPDTDKFLGKEPKIFTGNHNEAEAFLSQWNRFAGVNAANRSLKVPYIKAMMFLTYIQRPLIDEWATETTKWLDTQANKNDPWLWAGVELAFKGQFRDNLEKDHARVELDKGFKMINEDIDSYITKFEKLV